MKSLTKPQADQLGYFYGVYWTANIIMSWIVLCEDPDIREDVKLKVEKSFGLYADLEVAFDKAIKVYNKFLVWNHTHFEERSEWSGAINLFITEQILKIEEE